MFLVVLLSCSLRILLHASLTALHNSLLHARTLLSSIWVGKAHAYCDRAILLKKWFSYVEHPEYSFSGRNLTESYMLLCITAPLHRQEVTFIAGSFR